MRTDQNPGRSLPALTYDRFDPETEGRREALCALGNGVFVTRGAVPWADADDVHYPGTYLAGGYGRATSTVGDRRIENEDLVNLPNWLPMTFRVDDGPWFDLRVAEVLDFRQSLHLDRGLLQRRIDCRVDGGGEGTVRLRVIEERLVHLGRRNLAAQRLTVELDEPGPPVVLRAGIDGGVDNNGVARYDELVGHHAEVQDTGSGHDRIWLRTRVLSSGLEVAVGARVRFGGLSADDGPDGSATIDADVDDPGRVWISAAGRSGARVQAEKVVALHTSRDRAGFEPVTDVHRSLDLAPGFDELAASQARAWQRLWAASDLRLETDDDWVHKALALHQFHLHQTFSHHTVDLDTGVPARGWHGEAYRGHIFWDELFVLPLFDYGHPERTRAALSYRHRRLPEARRAAAAAGHRGAMFPWQSGSTGREESQSWHLNPRTGRWHPDPTHLQRHIGLAIGFNVWHHWRVTTDREFLHRIGAELILSIADFFADLARHDPAIDRYVIRRVIGPDEYHTAYVENDEPGLDDNAYTNVMASWLLARAMEVLALLPPWRRDELCASLGIDDTRLQRWDQVSRRLSVPMTDDRLILQFAGYDELEELDWDGLRERFGDIARLDRVLDEIDDTPNWYKASKQADVVMLFYLLTADELVDVLRRLGYRFEPDDIPRNVAYYSARTSHGSTLSRVVHSWVQARTDRAASWKWFREALASDVADIQGGTTAEGIHIGAMAGTVDLAQRGYSGLVVDGGTVRFNPRLPDEVRSLAFTIGFRVAWRLRVRITDEALDVGCEGSLPGPVRVAVKDEEVELAPGQHHRFDLAVLKADD